MPSPRHIQAVFAALFTAAGLLLSPLGVTPAAELPGRAPWLERLSGEGLARAEVAGEKWIHIRVVEQGTDGETVRINLPLRVVEKILPLVNNDTLKNGKLRTGRHSHLCVDGRNITASDLREIWQAVRTSPDGDFISVVGKHDNVRVARKDRHIVVKASEKSDENVEIRIPIVVMDALFSGRDSEELDLVAAVRALAQDGGMELVAVDDDDSRVRIWVDARHDSD